MAIPLHRAQSSEQSSEERSPEPGPQQQEQAHPATAGYLSQGPPPPSSSDVATQGKIDLQVISGVNLAEPRHSRGAKLAEIKKHAQTNGERLLQMMNFGVPPPIAQMTPDRVKVPKLPCPVSKDASGAVPLISVSSTSAVQPSGAVPPEQVMRTHETSDRETRLQNAYALLSRRDAVLDQDLRLSTMGISRKVCSRSCDYKLIKNQFAAFISTLADLGAIQEVAAPDYGISSLEANPDTTIPEGGKPKNPGSKESRRPQSPDPEDIAEIDLPAQTVDTIEPDVADSSSEGTPLASTWSTSPLSARSRRIREGLPPDESLAGSPIAIEPMLSRSPSPAVMSFSAPRQPRREIDSRSPMTKTRMERHEHAHRHPTDSPATRGLASPRPYRNMQGTPNNIRDAQRAFATPLHRSSLKSGGSDVRQASSQHDAGRRFHSDHDAVQQASRRMPESNSAGSPAEEHASIGTRARQWRSAHFQSLARKMEPPASQSSHNDPAQRVPRPQTERGGSSPAAIASSGRAVPPGLEALTNRSRVLETPVMGARDRKQASRGSWTGASNQTHVSSPATSPQGKVPSSFDGAKSTPAPISGSDIFDKFVTAYPIYTGDSKHFLAMCRKIQKLEAEDKMLHRSLWDDFIIRHETEYKPYLHKCAQEVEDSLNYEQFYRERVANPRHTLRIMHQESLRASLAQEPSSQGAPRSAARSTASSVVDMPDLLASRHASHAPMGSDMSRKRRINDEQDEGSQGSSSQSVTSRRRTFAWSAGSGRPSDHSQRVPSSKPTLLVQRTVPRVEPRVEAHTEKDIPTTIIDPGIALEHEPSQSSNFVEPRLQSVDLQRSLAKRRKLEESSPRPTSSERKERAISVTPPIRRYIEPPAARSFASTRYSRFVDEYKMLKVVAALDTSMPPRLDILEWHF
ncbi:hypothetical protein MRB53_037566 [Persea americana]|nr:hypothetical protein MRB53_037566 [Persea americana]